MKGPKPAPTALKLLRGEKNKDRINRSEPVPPAGLPEKPRDLLDSEGAYWDHFAPMLAGMRVLTPADTHGLRRLCKIIARLDSVENQVEHDGEVLIGKLGAKAHPLMPYLLKLDAEVCRWLAEFGLTPSSRSRVKTTGDSKGKLAEFLA